MLALERLGSRVEEERSYVNKYSQSPLYRDNIEWLYGISHKLGPPHVCQFFATVAQALVSPVEFIA